MPSWPDSRLGADREAAAQLVLLRIAQLGAVLLIGNLLEELASYVGDAQGLAVSNHVSVVVHSKAVEVDLEAYENPKYYDTLSRVQREAAFRPNQVVRGLLQTGQSAISLLAVAGLLVSLHWAVALLLFLVTLPGAWVQFRFSNKMYRWQRSRTPTERQVSYFNWMLSTDQAAKEIRLFHLGRCSSSGSKRCASRCGVSASGWREKARSRSSGRERRRPWPCTAHTRSWRSAPCRGRSRWAA
jgi:ATP-binding cassette subfamily B protein